MREEASDALTDIQPWAIPLRSPEDFKPPRVAIAGPCTWGLEHGLEHVDSHRRCQRASNLANDHSFVSIRGQKD